MSLVMGIHLLRKLYLVSDTRVTYQRDSGLIEIRDDLIKMFVLNKRLGAVAAGHLPLAAFILQRLKGEVGEDGRLSNLKDIIERRVDALIRDYVSATGRDDQQAGLIFAGFDDGEGKRIDATRLGDVISLPARRAGGGVVLEQPIDRALVAAFEAAFAGTNRLDRGAMLDVKVPASGMFSVKIVVRRDGFEAQRTDIACYEYAMYHSDQTFRTVQLPDDVIATLEFRPLRSPEDEFYGDAAHLIAFVRQALAEHRITTAGGHVFVVLQTQIGAIHTTGELMAVQEGRLARIGGIKASADARLVYTLGDGVERPYRTLNQVGDQLTKLTDEELGIALI